MRMKIGQVSGELFFFFVWVIFKKLILYPVVTQIKVEIKLWKNNKN